MFLRVHAGSDQRQLVRAMPGRTHAAAMRFGDHAGIDVPAPECPRLDVLRAEGLGQGHGTRNVVRIRLRLDSPPLLIIEGPVTVELKATIADSRAWKDSGGESV